MEPEKCTSNGTNVGQFCGVEWTVDIAGSNDVECGDENPPPIITALKRIPRFSECPSLEEELQRKLGSKKADEVQRNITQTKKAARKNKLVEEALLKSVIKPGFEQLKAVPAPVTNRRALRKERRIARERNKGPGWYNLPAQEMTDEIKNDIDLLRMRSVLDPKRVYKKNDLSHVPKYFQMGTVLGTAADFYNGRIPKSQQKKTLLGELMADRKARALQKMKFKAIVQANSHKKRRPDNKTKLSNSEIKAKRKKKRQDKKKAGLQMNAMK